MSTCSLSPLAEVLITNKHESRSRESFSHPVLIKKPGVQQMSLLFGLIKVFMAGPIVHPGCWWLADQKIWSEHSSIKTVNNKLIQFGCCYIAIVTAPRFSPLIRLMELNALTHTAGYECLVPLMDSEDITALPSLSGTSLGQSERQAAACNHSDSRTRTDRSVVGEKWPEFECTHIASVG